MSVSSSSDASAVYALGSQGFVTSQYYLKNNEFSGPGSNTIYSGQTPTKGGQFAISGDVIDGHVYNRVYANISSWRSGKSYGQYAMVTSPAVGQAYTKTYAGAQISLDDPSTAAGAAYGWVLSSTQPGPRVFNGAELVASTVVLKGDQPAQMYFLSANDNAVEITAKPYNGTNAAESKLRVNGLLDCEGLTITNNYHTAPNTTKGTATLVAGTTGAIANTSVNASSTILVQRTSASAATDGALSSQAGAGTFTITSNNAGDVSVVTWIVINPVQTT